MNLKNMRFSRQRLVLRTVIKVLDGEIIKLLIAECLFDKNLDPGIKE